MLLTSPRLLAPLWTLAILVGLTLPGSQLPDSFLLEYDKIIHGLLFFVLTLLWLAAFSRAKWGSALAVFTVILAFSVLSELYQAWLPFGRHADFLDSAADAFGALIGLGVWIPLRHHLESWAERGRKASVQKR
ncbi:MAG: VanZ family protein [Bacteroidota bacterium]|nr:VanZ family protein [Bacteroidota bacterium]